MKKKLSIIALLIVSIIAIINIQIFYHTSQEKKYEKFYLDNKYYQSENFIKVNSKEISKLKNNNYILFTYNNYCTLPIPCEFIFEEFMKEHKISFLSISFEEFKKTNIYKKVKYAPSIIIVKNGKIISYLDANSDEDLDKYQDVCAFEKWLENYIYFTNK